jgi:hypothetical protein
LSHLSAQNRPVVLASLLTGLHDVNRDATLEADDFGHVAQWAEAIRVAGLLGIIFHNGFSLDTVARHTGEHLRFERVTADPAYNPNVNRYFFYRDFLLQHAGEFSDVALTDISDVVIVRNPFTAAEYLAHPAAIFCGDEPKTLDNPWMQAHSAHFRKQVPGFADYEAAFAQSTLLNCGVVLGKVSTICSLLEQLCQLHLTYNRHNPSAYTGDMGAFNYVVRTHFTGRTIHGTPVNTVFKSYETTRTDAWFRHK